MKTKFSPQVAPRAARLVERVQSADVVVIVRVDVATPKLLSPLIEGDALSAKRSTVSVTVERRP